MHLVLLMPTILGLTGTQTFYVTENGYVDIDAVIADSPSLQAYVDCFLDKGPCTPTTQSYKDIIQETVTRACDRCNVPQKQRYGRFLLGLRERLSQEYQTFREKYDPMNIYMDAIEHELFKYANQPL